MCRSHSDIDMGFTAQRSPPGTHMCLIYSDEAERKKIVTDFLTAGLAAGEKVACFADDMRPDATSVWLDGISAELSSKDQSERFIVRSTGDAYYPHGEFAPEKSLNTLRSFYDASVKERCRGTRATGNAGFILSGVPGSELFMEYEACVNQLWDTHPVTALRQYDARRFDGGVLHDVLKVHPMMIVNGQIVRNPSYIPPKTLHSSPARKV